MASSRFLFIIVLLATFIHQTDAAVTVSLNTVSSWNGGSQMQVVVKNTGPKPVCAVKIELSTPSGTSIANSWNLDRDGGGNGQFNLASWVKIPAGGQSTDAGFVVSGIGQPNVKLMSSQECGGSGPSPPGPGPNPSPPTTTTTTTKPNPGGGGGGGGGCCPYGKLAVRGTQLVGSNGQPVQLRGMSLFWSQLPDGAPFFNEQTVKCLKCNWRANVVRDTMTVEDNGQWQKGYLSDPAKEYAKMEAVVDAAIKNCMYVLVDWHTTTGAVPPVDRAVDFFKRISAKCAGKCNCLYETWNEPVQVDWSSQVKPYHEKVLAAIRQNDRDGVVILGNPNWDHAQDQVAANPIMNQQNIMYTLHFYAAEQGQDQQRGIVQQAMQRGVPIFVTEYGTTMGTGDGSPNFAETNKWYQFLDANKISYINWSLGTKTETSSALRPGSTPADVCSDSKDTESGAFVKRMLRAKNPAPQGC